MKFFRSLVLSAVLSFALGVSALAYGNTAPASPLYSNCVFVTGTDSQLGTVTVYFPYQSADSWGVNSSGYLVNVGSSSWSGRVGSSYGVRNNTISAGSFNLPTYSVTDGNSWDTRTLSLLVTDTNANLSDDLEPFVDSSLYASYFLVMLLGGVFICSKVF